MNYYELIYLKKELNFKLADCFVEQVITPFKNQLELFIAGEEKSFRLIFSATPGNSALFLDTYRPAKKSNTVQFFEPICGAKIVGVNIIKHDRFLWIEFENGYRLWFRLFGNNANVLLTQHGKVVDSFKDHDELGNLEPNPPKKKLYKAGELAGSVIRKIQQLTPLFPKWELVELTTFNQLETFEDDELTQFVIECATQKEVNPEFRILMDGRTTMLNEHYLPISTKQTVDDVNELIRFRFKNYVHQQRLHQQKNEATKLLKRQLKRLDSALGNLAQADKGLEKAALYERYGHLLMASAHLGKPASAKLKLDDFYHQGHTVTIPVDETLSIAQNAEHYYKRSAASLTSYKEAQDRIPKLEARKHRLEKMLSTSTQVLDLRELEDWKKRFRKELETLGIGSKNKKRENLPFHTLELEGYQIWLGKNAKSNDKVVQLSHKEDVWMHARGVPGSHLVLRMQNNKLMPNKKVLEEAAAFAAYHSKARGSKLVPVIVTKRKYVRKPKGAAPGAVLVQKEEVVIVEPKNPMG